MSRLKFDDYPTPPWPIARFLEQWIAGCSLPIGKRWLEPCAGAGIIIDRVNSVVDVSWEAWELQEHYEERLLLRTDAVRIGDCLKLARQYSPGSFDVTITNPPYRLAMPVLLEMRRISTWVVLLLRRTFVGSAKRHPYLSKHMPDEYILPDRPSFIWRHHYTLSCTGCSRIWKRFEDQPAGVPAAPVHSLMGSCEVCGSRLKVSKVQTNTSDSTEYVWCVWGPNSGPIGSTRMLALTPAEERRC
jgi:hypothetical protein